jgi:Ca-activated chloride channel family protein
LSQAKSSGLRTDAKAHSLGERSGGGVAHGSLPGDDLEAPLVQGPGADQPNGCRADAPPAQPPPGAPAVREGKAEPHLRQRREDDAEARGGAVRGPVAAAHDRAALDLAHPVPREAIVARIKTIDERGSTDLFGGWEEGVKQLAPFTRKDRIARVILLSDGQANQGLVVEQEIFARVTKAAGAGITTSTVGLGHGFNESLMTGMANAGEGIANFGQTADDLDEAFEEQFAIISNSFLRQVKVSVQGGSDVQARLVGELLEEGAARSRKLGTLPWDASLVAVVELKIGAGAKPDALAAVNFEGVTKEGEVVMFGPQIIALPETDLVSFSVLPVDASVAAAVSEALISEKIEAIEALARRGKIAEAKQEFEELLKRSDLTDWAKQKVEYLRNLLDEDAIMAMKEMRYGRSRMLRQTKASMMRDFDTEFCQASEDSKPIYLQKKVVAGTARKPKPPQGGQTNGQTPQA